MDILSKIEKLERLAANPGTPAEGVAAAAKAAELRKKFCSLPFTKRNQIDHYLDDVFGEPDYVFGSETTTSYTTLDQILAELDRSINGTPTKE